MKVCPPPTKSYQECRQPAWNSPLMKLLRTAVQGRFIFNMLILGPAQDNLVFDHIFHLSKVREDIT